MILEFRGQFPIQSFHLRIPKPTKILDEYDHLT